MATDLSPDKRDEDKAAFEVYMNHDWPLWREHLGSPHYHEKLRAFMAGRKSCALSHVAEKPYRAGYLDGIAGKPPAESLLAVSAPSTTRQIDPWVLYVEAFRAMFPGHSPIELSATALQEMVDRLRTTPSAMGTLTERERVVLGNLIHLADAVHHALDDSEELEDKSINVTEEHYNMLCLAVACLDDLPDDKPGCIMCPAAKAQWALRRIMGEQENNAADGGKQT